MKIEIELPDPPPDLEYTGEYRSADPHEPYLLNDVFMVSGCSFGTTAKYPILRKKKPQRLIFEQVMPSQDVPIEQVYCLDDDGSLRSSRRTAHNYVQNAICKGRAFVRAFDAEEEKA